MTSIRRLQRFFSMNEPPKFSSTTLLDFSSIEKDVLRFLLDLFWHWMHVGWMLESSRIPVILEFSLIMPALSPKLDGDDSRDEAYFYFMNFFNIWWKLTKEFHRVESIDHKKLHIMTNQKSSKCKWSQRFCSFFSKKNVIQWVSGSMIMRN
jgi:hypothetical protein